jgi:hypothetical protein
VYLHDTSCHDDDRELDLDGAGMPEAQTSPKLPVLTPWMPGN